MDEKGWQLSVDSTGRLDALQVWLAENTRDIKLPELLIEVDNELHFTDRFSPVAQRRDAKVVCAVLAAIMAHGCNVVPYTMARLTGDITYR